MKMLRYGYRVTNVPTYEYKRRFGQSHIHIWKEWPKFVWCVLVNLIPKHAPKRLAHEGVKQPIQEK